MRGLRVLLVSAILVLPAAPAGSNFMDKSTCLQGATRIMRDLADHINGVSERLAACVNYINDREVENHNNQQELLRELAELERR
ncbi:hypothetical protein CIT31_29745 [Mesorhizobium wenxiniae]|uniref:Uncharacterized protein n=2 Tax=Mesorhizobium wenxiniae TaxID=2014805 RepID=A0A271K9H5_9HYPH|nr:hypothetical protein CIT31_29745 [Mesorhizobium wenxiniae]